MVRHVCGGALGGVDPGDAFRAHIGVHAPDALRGPFNHEQRVAAGLEPDWYSVGPEHRMGREGEEQLGGTDARALVGRLAQMLALEGVDPEEDIFNKKAEIADIAGSARLSARDPHPPPKKN